MNTALERYNTVSRAISDGYMELSKLDVAILQDFDQSYQQAVADGLSYNPASARAKSATMRWQIERLKLQAEIDGFLVELRYLDQFLNYATRE